MAKKEAYEEVLGRITYAQPASSQGFAKGAGFSEDWPPAAAHEGEQGRGAAGRTTPLLSCGGGEHIDNFCEALLRLKCHCQGPGDKGTMNTSAAEALQRKEANLENFRKYGSDPFGVAVVHGGPGAAGEVAPIARKLGETRGVLEPIQTARTLDGQVEELRLVVEQNAAKPVIFIGHSWGAWLSYIVTARYPALVRKLILVGSGPFEEKYVKLIAENRLRRLSQEEKEEYLHIVDILNTSETPDSNVFLSRLGDLVHKADACDPIEIPEDTTSLDLVDNSGEIYQGVWPEAARLRRTGELLRLSVNITCPVVAIHGDCDPHPAQGIQEPLAANLKDFRMIILEKCGHDPWRERHAMDTFYAILEHELSTGRP